jgi:hypothetical protein
MLTVVSTSPGTSATPIIQQPTTSTAFDKIHPKCYDVIEAVQPLPLYMAIKPAFAPAAQIEHSKYGLGSVLSCNEEHIVIKFDDHGEKKFVLSIALAALKKSDRQPPVEKRRATRKKAVPVVAAAAKE